MPAVLALPAFWGAVAATAGGAATVYGVKKAGEQTDKGIAASTAANTAAIDEQKRQDDLQKQQFDQQQAAAKAQWDAQQAIRAPYRQAGSAALSSLGGILGVDFGSGGGGGGSSASAPAASSIDPKIAAFIADYQAKNPDGARAGIAPLADAVAKQFPGVNRFMYGNTPSNNELSIGGQKFKVINEGNGTWYVPGTNDGAGGGSSGFMAPRSIAPSVLPMGNIPNALAASYAPVVPITSLMGAVR